MALQTFPKLRDWPRQPVLPSGGHLQESVDAIRALAGQNPDFTRPPDRILYARFPAFIDTAGPNKEANYTDERYWVTRVYIDKATAATDTIKFVTEDKAIDPVLTYTAVNLAEIRTKSHAMPKRTYVQVEAWLDHSDPQRIRYYINKEPPWRLAIKAITWTDSTTLGTGQYRCRIQNAPTGNMKSLKNTSPLAGSTFFGTEGTVDVLAFNVQEETSLLTSGTHDLSPETGPSAGTFSPVTFPAQLHSIDDDDAFITFLINADQWRNC